MRKTISVLAAIAVVMGLFAVPAVAKKRAKPVATKLFLHGSTFVGEADSFSLVADGYLPMSPEKPSADVKSRQLTNYLGGPNTQCAGNNLFPVWSGPLTGQVKGDVKLSFSAIGTPGKAVVRIWPDIGSSMCDSAASGTSDYPDPAGEVVVDLPAGPGTVEAVMKNVNFKAVGSVIVQVSPAVLADIPDPGGSVLEPFMSRVLYDSPDYPSVLEFKCIPTKGKTCS